MFFGSLFLLYVSCVLLKKRHASREEGKFLLVKHPNAKRLFTLPRNKTCASFGHFSRASRLQRFSARYDTITAGEKQNNNSFLAPKLHRQFAPRVPCRFLRILAVHDKREKKWKITNNNNKRWKSESTMAKQDRKTCKSKRRAHT